MPLIVSPSLIQNTPDDTLAERLARPHIGWHTVTTSQFVSMPAPLKDPLTWNRWVGSSNGTSFIDIDRNSIAAAGPINYIGIASHNLGSRGTASVSISHFRHDGGWTNLVTFTPTSDDAIMVLLEDEVTPPPGHFDQWSIAISQAQEAPQIGTVYMGRVLVMPHSIYGGHSPGTLSRDTEILPNVSVDGRFLGRSIVRRGYRTGYEFRHLPAGWYREHFDPFVDHALRDPFFIAWKPDSFPGEVLYGWTPDDIRPVNMGVRDLMSVSFDVQAWR